MIAIVVSRADSASEHIGERLLELGDWTAHQDSDRPDSEGGGTYYRADGFELREFDDLHIELDDPATAFVESPHADGPPDVLAFVSRHSGETGRLLTAHVTGNFGPAPYGGEPETLARAAPGAEKRVVEALATHAPEGYEVGIECTHHGPTDVSVPSLFVELGSDEPQWTDPEAARAVAQAVLDLRGTGVALRSGIEGDRPRHVVGFGGGHYAPRFTRIVRETEWAVGHVGADWALAEMGAPAANEAVIEQAFARSEADIAVIEGDRPELAAVIEGLGYRVVSETWVRAVGDRPLAVVERLEERLGSVDEGLRFGGVQPPNADADTDDDPKSIRFDSLPSELLSRAQGVDAEATRTAVEANAVAFQTEQSGTRAASRAAFTAESDAPGYAELVADLASVLKRRYDEVAVDSAEGVVVARRTAFDPERAAIRGVPEGPAFGRLADGESVEVEGETIEPADVSRTQTERYPIDPISDNGSTDTDKRDTRVTDADDHRASE